MTQSKGCGQTQQEDDGSFGSSSAFVPSLIAELGSVRSELWSTTIQMIKCLGDGSPAFPFLEKGLCKIKNLP